MEEQLYPQMLWHVYSYYILNITYFKLNEKYNFARQKSTFLMCVSVH